MPVCNRPALHLPPLLLPMPVGNTTSLADAYARQMEGVSGKWREHRENDALLMEGAKGKWRKHRGIDARV